MPLLPRHHTYVEPYGGGAAVLLEKEPAGFEVYNDINGDLVNFFKILRDRPEELIRMIELTPYAREAYEESGEPGGTRSAVERARQFITASWMTVAGFEGRFRSGSDWRRLLHYTDGNHAPPSREWAKLGDRLWGCSQRLRSVQIDNKPATEIIRAYDGPGVCFYIDPPYVASTRSGPKRYAGEMDEEQHAELLGQLLKCQGAAVISGYRSELYESVLRGLERHDFEVTLHSTRAGVGQHRGRRLECVWVKRETTAPGSAQRSLLEVAT